MCCTVSYYFFRKNGLAKALLWLESHRPLDLKVNIINSASKQMSVPGRRPKLLPETWDRQIYAGKVAIGLCSKSLRRKMKTLQTFLEKEIPRFNDLEYSTSHRSGHTSRDPRLIKDPHFWFQKTRYTDC